MKRFLYIFVPALVGVILFLVAAAPPAPVYRNAWTTNAGAGPVHGTSDLQVSNANDVIWNFFSGGTSTVARIFDVTAATNLFLVNQFTTNFPGQPVQGPVSLIGNLTTSNVTVNGWQSQNGTGSSNTSSSISTAPTSLFGSTNVIFAPTNASAGYVLTSDAVGNGRWQPLAVGTNNFIATLTTTDNTTNTIYSFIPTNSACVRVFANIVAWNSTSSASYGKLGTFKNVAGTVSIVGGTSTIGSGEDDAAFESLMNVSGTSVRIQVAGDTARTVNWVAYIQLFYAP